jgi:hypothetical protein
MNPDFLGSVQRIIIEFEVQRGHSMNDWISQLKQQQETTQRATQAREEWTLRCDAIVSSKGPGLWDDVVSQIRLDIDKLKKAFPDDPTKHLQFAAQSDYIEITKPMLPSAQLRCRWVEQERIISILLSKKEHSYSEVRQSKNQIHFSVVRSGDTDVVRMMLDGSAYVLAEDVSEQLIKKLL